MLQALTKAHAQVQESAAAHEKTLQLNALMQTDLTALQQALVQAQTASSQAEVLCHHFV